MANDNFIYEPEEPIIDDSVKLRVFENALDAMLLIESDKYRKTINMLRDDIAKLRG